MVVAITMGLVARAVGLLFVVAFVQFAVRLYHVRSAVRCIQTKHGIAILPHSFLMGHLIVVGKVMAKHQTDTNGTLLPRILMEEYPEICKAGLVYIDLWPVSYPMLAVFHPDLMSQFCQDPSLPKHEMLHHEFMPFTQCKDILNLEGQEWKKWRSMFNPGFSAKNVLSLVPAFVEEVLVFKKYLDGVAETGETIALEKQAMKATTDVIGRAVLGTRLHVQTAESVIYKTMKTQIAWLIVQLDPPNIMRLLNPFRIPLMWNNNRIMTNAMLPLIEHQIRHQDDGNDNEPKTINSLAIRGYLADESSPPIYRQGKVDTGFLDNTIAQLKIFLFAGHDTTSSALCYAYYMLHRNPDVLAKLRAEHDEVLGPDCATTADLITSTPTLLNQLIYTSAVLKETLRLYPPVGSVRQGSPSVYLTHPDTHQRYPTDGWLLFAVSHAVQRHPDFWPEADRFLPERWLAKEGDRLHVKKNTYRPFELGPRNCIGQELAQTELRLILALTVRELDIIPMYPEDGPRVFGELGYQADLPGEITAHPKDGMPVRIKLRKGMTS